MKFPHSVVTYALAGAMVLGLSACGATSDAAQQSASQAAATTSATTTAPGASATPDSSSQPAESNMFGGPIYHGQPDLAATAALIDAGGGAANFSFQSALVSMLGEGTVNAEVAKLTKQYSADDVKGFIDGADFVVNDAIKLVTAAGITLPAAPADLHGADLAKALVKAGTAPDGTFWSGYLLDQTLSHDIHNQVMADVDASAGVDADLLTHKLLNQAMFDVAQALGMTDVQLAALH
jgi:hypothetical protein